MNRATDWKQIRANYIARQRTRKIALMVSEGVGAVALFGVMYAAMVLVMCL